MKLKYPAISVLAAAAAFSLVACSAPADSGSSDSGSTEEAAAFPTERIRFIVPYSAGGPTDVTARALAPCLTDQLGETVVVENVEGGSGAVGLQQTIGSKADGHTIAIVSTGMVVLTPLVGDLSYGQEDVTPIGVLSEVPFQIVVGADSKFSSAKEFFDYARKNPGELNVGVSGASTPQAIELARMADEYGVELTVVPFDGSAGATTALLGNHVDAAILNDTDDVLARTEDGSFVPLVVTSAERQPHLPDVPTLVELGFEDLTLAVTTYALAGPAGLPANVVETHAAALETCLSDETTVKAIGERFVLPNFIDGAGFSAILEDAERVYGEILG